MCQPFLRNWQSQLAQNRGGLRPREERFRPFLRAIVQANVFPDQITIEMGQQLFRLEYR